MVKKLVSAAFAALFCLSCPALAFPFTALNVFGDSLADSGNAFFGLQGTITVPPFPLIPDAPYPRGPLVPAFTNGPNWAEVLGAHFGLPVVPSILGGTSFAIGGADTGPLPLVPPNGSPTLLTQFNGPASPPSLPFFGGPAAVDPNALYAIWAGNNDIRRALDVYFAVLSSTGGDSAAALAAASAVVTAGVGNVASVLAGIAAGGGRHILSLNISDVGLAPAIDFLPPGTGAVATGLAAGFNAGLAAAINAIETQFLIDIAQVDTFTLLQNIVSAPASFGLSNATDPCLQIGGAGVCADPDAFMFWDGIHPTAAGHRIIGAAAIAAVPIPGTALLLVLGLALIVRQRRVVSPLTRHAANGIR